MKTTKGNNVKNVLTTIFIAFTALFSQHSFAQPGRVELIDNQEVKSFTWHLGGFNTVMLINAKINNKSSVAVKDLTLECQTFSKSGTLLSRTSKVIYELIPAGKSIRVKEFSMGFVNSQSSKAYCKVADLAIAQAGK